MFLGSIGGRRAKFVVHSLEGRLDNNGEVEGEELASMDTGEYFRTAMTRAFQFRTV